MTALRCARALHAVGDDTGRIERFCRDCTRHLAPNPNFDEEVYHYWRFMNGRWPMVDTVIKRTPKG